MKNKKIRVALLGAMSMLAGGQALATSSVPSAPLANQLERGAERALEFTNTVRILDKVEITEWRDYHDYRTIKLNGALSELSKSDNVAFVVDVDTLYFHDDCHINNVDSVELTFYEGSGLTIKNNLTWDYGSRVVAYGDWSTFETKCANSDDRGFADDFSFTITVHGDGGEKVVFGGQDPVDVDFNQAVNLSLVTYEKAPGLINGGSQTINVNLDDPVSLDDIKSRINAYDLFGQDLDFTMTPKGNPYDPSSLKIGSYTYTLHCQDQWGQEADATLIINVVDITAPTVTPKAISKGYSDQLTFDDLKGAITATDTSTSAGGGGLTYKFTASTYGAITAEKPLQLTAEMAKAGSLSVSAEVSDSSGNTGKATVQVTITDNVAPVIARTGGQEIGEVIQVPLNTMDDAESAKRAWLANYTATDAVDGEVAISVEGFPESFSDIVLGEMEVTLKATDKAGNEASQVVKIDITSTAADLPYYVLDDLLLSTTGSNPLSAEMIATAGLDMLTDDLGFTPSSVSVGEATYQYYLNHYQYDGTYQIVLNYTVPSTGAEGVAKAVGAEAGLEEKSSVMTIESYSSKKRSIWTKIADWFSDTWQRFCNWFTGKGWHTDRELEIKAATADSVIE